MPHGHSNAVVLPGVLAYNAEQAWKEYAELAYALLPEAQGLPAQQASQVFVDYMSALVGRMPFSLKLSDSGVKESDLNLLASDAMKVDRLLQNNPREMTYQAAYEIYQAIL